MKKLITSLLIIFSFNANACIEKTYQNLSCQLTFEDGTNDVFIKSFKIFKKNDRYYMHHFINEKEKKIELNTPVQQNEFTEYFQCKDNTIISEKKYKDDKTFGIITLNQNTVHFEGELFYVEEYCNEELTDCETVVSKSHTELNCNLK